ncbi:UNVERIFIED_CONTAM: YTH domain-containing protein ECT4 [Sesamum radiatum]|uniref:YTH domain-containing family protein n=1 Tax=Sesamum radiatum TaxID=300843 RepID=A0AAW2MYW4_SESRA
MIFGSLTDGLVIMMLVSVNISIVHQLFVFNFVSFSVFRECLVEPELITPGPISDSTVKLSEKDMGKDGIPSDSISSVSAASDTVSGSKVVDQASALEHGVYYPATSCYDYYYPGYNCTFAQSDDKGYFNAAGGSYRGIQSDNTSLLYYLPGYPYATGYMGADGKPTYASSEYLQQPGSYGSEAFPCYSYDSTYSGSGSTGKAAGSGSVKSVMGQNSSVKSSVPLLKQIPISQARLQHCRIIQKFIFLTDVRCAMRMSYLDLYLRYPAVRSMVQYITNQMVEYGTTITDQVTRNFGRNAEFEALTEFSWPQIEYDDAKFYVIKSYSEDDVHKCIKYDVWSSTPNGNRKLDAAFREADAKTSETGTKCPVFLFFSVNGSGQFVGVAEMLGQVDFSKNMDFWQLDKWNGFFPIKWHIIKDVPNALLRHIILENNENRPVTYSRDTQEIGLKQGLEMLSIFKTHSGKTSVLDDFNFYEDREKSLKAKRNSRAASQTNGFQSGDRKKRSEGGEGIIREQPTKTNEPDPSSLISLTKNLSLNSQPLKSSI